jgi:RNA 2',3'-cyclic 3'-phosphodiesterase
MRVRLMKDAGPKTPTAAVVWIPPESVWEPIQTIRRRYDRHLLRWMPHMTLLYPFRPREQFGEIEPLLREACAEIPPFEADFREIRSFQHGPQSHTMWAAPEPEAAFRELQSVLQAKVPDCDDVSKYESGFTPHLSLGQSHGPPELTRRLSDVRKSWVPLQVPVKEIALIARIGETAFFVDRTIPLG